MMYSGLDDPKKKIIEIAYEVIDEVNKNLKRGSISKDLDSNLFESGNLDSMAFVNFVVTLEDKISKEFHKSIALTSIDALDNGEAPFKNLKSLVNYIARLVIKS